MQVIRILIYLFVLLSFVPASILSIDFGLFQLSVFRVLLIVLPVLISFDTFKLRGNQLLQVKNEILTYPTIFSVIWVAYALLSFFWVKDMLAWMKSNYFIGLGLFSIIIMQLYLKSIEDFKMVFKIIVFITAINIVIGSTEILTHRYLFLNSERVIKYSKNNYPVSWYSNTNNFSTLMLLGFNIAFACISSSKGKLQKIYYTVISVLSVTLLLLTRSRANELGLFLSVLIIGFFFVKIDRKRILLLISVIIASLVLIEFLHYTNIIADNRLDLSFQVNASDFSTQETSTLVADEIPKGSDSIRINLIKNGLIFLKESYGFGVGAGNIEYWMAHFSIYNTRGIMNIHNWWAEILVGYGVLIFLGYLIFYGYLFFIPCLDLLHGEKIDDYVVIALTIVAFLGGYSIGSMSASSNISNEGIWVFMGIITAFVKTIPTAEYLTRVEKSYA